MTTNKLGTANQVDICSVDEWQAEARTLFGPDPMVWRFQCPCCGHIASVQDYKDAGAPTGAVAFSCIGRWTNCKREAFRADGPGPCNYAGGGLIGLNPRRVIDESGIERDVFAFAKDKP
ncbi:unnamed protein product [marine sediment metagenome]|uniref:Uncharacterized protein n=1 Tax=marine sediment metagenome TaxID=412755 RepID=X0SC74_9ZZZZ